MNAESNPLRKRVLKESLWTLATTAISRFGGLLFTILLARYLLPEGFGLYSLALSIAIIFITFADAGINQTLLRYVSSSIDTNKKKASAYFRYLLRIKIKLTLLSAGVLLLASYPLAYFVFDKPLLFPLLIIFSFYTFTAALQGFFESLFYTKNEVKRLAQKEFLFQIFRLGALGTVFLLVSQEEYLIGSALALLFAALASFLLLLLFYRNLFNFERSSERIDKKRVWAFMGFITISSLAGVLFSYMDTVIMGMYLSAEYLGYYRAVINIVIAMAGALSFPGVFLAVLTKIKENQLQLSFDRIIRYLMILVIPAIVGIMILSRYFIVFLYGYEYLVAAPLTYILAPLILFFVTTSIFLSLLAAREKIKEFSKATLMCTCLNLILLVVGIQGGLYTSPLRATEYAALATLVSWFVYFILGTRILKKRQKIIFRYRLMAKPLVASLGMALILYTLNAYGSDMTLFKGIGEVILGAGVYFAILYLLRGFSREDIVLIRSLMRR